MFIVISQSLTMEPLPVYSRPRAFPQEVEEVSTIHADSKRDWTFQQLVQIIIDWINNELSSQRIIVRDLETDLYDGQVLQKLFEKLSNKKLKLGGTEVAVTEIAQREKLANVIQAINIELRIRHESQEKWNVKSIFSRDLLATMHLLIAMFQYFQPKSISLPKNVTIKKIVAQKRLDGQIKHWIVTEVLNPFVEVEVKQEKDDFDTLFEEEHTEELEIVKNSLKLFVSNHLAKLQITVTEIESQFHDGVYLIFLIGLLEGFFVPLYQFHVTPHDFLEKVHNVSFFFQLLLDLGISKLKVNPEDIVNKDLKSTLRVLSLLLKKYKC